MVKQPNLVIILADDLGVGDVGCYNRESKISTPNIDSVAQSGVQFTQSYAPGSVCTQTRYGLLTGRYHFRTDRRGDGVIFDYTEPIIGSEPTIQRVLSDCNYNTYCSGKWHLGMNWVEHGEKKREEESLFRNEMIDFTAPFEGPTATGFDNYYGIRASLDHPPYCFLEDGHVVGYPGGEKETYYSQQRPGPASGTWDDQQVDRQFTRRALSYLMDAAQSDTQFFLYLPTSAPHRPCLPPPQMEGKTATGARGDMVAQFDWTVGQIDRQLKRLGIREETILIIASDHGARPADVENGHDPTDGLRGQKGTLYEGGIRVPLVVRWPEVGSAQIDSPVSLIDLFPTVCDIIGHDVDGLDGQSLKPLLNGQSQERLIISEDGSGQLAVREGEWKYIQGTGDTNAQLYNLRDDPDESNNRASTNEAVAESLRQTLLSV